MQKSITRERTKYKYGDMADEYRYFRQGHVALAKQVHPAWVADKKARKKPLSSPPEAYKHTKNWPLSALENRERGYCSSVVTKWMFLNNTGANEQRPLNLWQAALFFGGITIKVKAKEGIDDRAQCISKKVFQGCLLEAVRVFQSYFVTLSEDEDEDEEIMGIAYTRIEPDSVEQVIKYLRWKEGFVDFSVVYWKKPRGSTSNVPTEKENKFSGHALGFYRSGNTIRFIEPNRGEVKFSSFDAFADWFRNETKDGKLQFLLGDNGRLISESLTLIYYVTAAEKLKLAIHHNNLHTCTILNEDLDFFKKMEPHRIAELANLFLSSIDFEPKNKREYEYVLNIFLNEFPKLDCSQLEFPDMDRLIEYVSDSDSPEFNLAETLKEIKQAQKAHICLIN